MSGAADVLERALARSAEQGSSYELEKMLGAPAEVFPGMVPEVADWYFALVAFHCLAPGVDFDNDCLAWWRALPMRSRVFLCRVAGVEKERAAAEWPQLKHKERAQLVARFMWLHEFVNAMRPPVPAYRPCTMELERGA